MRHTVQILFAGDVIFGRAVASITQVRGIGYLFEQVASFMRSADWVVANLEGCISLRGTPMEKEYQFRAPPALAPELFRAGIRMVTLANNHSMDYGALALEDTLSYLQSTGVWWAGAGVNCTQASEPVVLEKDGLSVAFVCFTAVVPRGFPAGKCTPGVATLRDVLPVLKRIRQQVEVVIAIPHWGDEGTHEPNAKQKRIAHLLSQQGVDLVIGHHPHVIQGYERIGSTQVVYSVGNFVHAPRSVSARRALLVRATIARNRKIELEAIPLWLEAGRPTLAPEPHALVIAQLAKPVPLVNGYTLRRQRGTG